MLLTLTPALPAVSASGDPLLAEVWVGPGGSDVSGTGSRTAPYRTVTKACSRVEDDGTINVLPGTYDAAAGETFPITLSPAVHLRGIGPGKPRIVGPDFGTVIKMTSPVGARITGLDISGGGPVNYGDEDGNGIYVLMNDPGGSIEIRDCYIHDNVAGRFWSGGGIEVRGPLSGTGTVRIIDCVVADNQAGMLGGGIHIGRGVTDVTIGRTRVIGNTCYDVQARGGGLYVTGASPLFISDSEFSGNRADDEAGGLCLEQSTGLLSQVVVTGNTSRLEPSALLVDTGNVEVKNSTIADNHLSPANPSATYAVQMKGAGGKTLLNTIVWGNTPAAIGSVVVLNRVCTDDPDRVGAPGLITEDPLFIHPGDEGPDYRVFRDSPCVDAGSAVGPYNDFDIDGRPRVTDGDGDGTAVVDIGAYETGSLTRRLAGEDRYETAMAVWAGPQSIVSLDEPVQGTNSAVITVGSNFPDALAASALAGAVDGVLVLTRTDTLPTGLVTYLDGLGVTGAYIVGGTTVVSPAVQTTLQNAGLNVVRIGGADRYETAANVASEVKRLLGDRFTNQCFVARGDAFPDALAASPWAYTAGVPVVLTQPGSLPGATSDILAECGTSGVYIVGGTSAVSAEVAAAIDALPGVPTPRRLAGADRYETAVEVARAAAGMGPNGADAPPLGWHEIGLATGVDFPDALAGGAATGARGGVLLLTHPDALSPATDAALIAQRLRVSRVTVIGGTSAVTEIVRTAAGSAIQ
jgi:putative cell wall-binding protein